MSVGPSIEKLEKLLIQATPTPLRPLVSSLLSIFQWCLFISSASSLLFDRDFVKAIWRWLVEASPKILQTVVEFLGHTFFVVVSAWRAVTSPIRALIEKLLSLQIEQWQFDLLMVLMLVTTSFVRIASLRRKVQKMRGRFENARRIADSNDEEIVSLPPLTVEGGLVVVGEKPPTYPSELVAEIQTKLKAREAKIEALIRSTAILVCIAAIVSLIVLLDNWLHRG